MLNRLVGVAQTLVGQPGPAQTTRFHGAKVLYAMDAWPGRVGEHEYDRITVDDAEYEDVLAVLTASTDSLPPSARTFSEWTTAFVPLKSA